ncbi:tetraacyldisaccharide 4'-kinase [Acinetobacter colistiniresistens]|uniref:Tetraacyldisaccharide 4'-kinase n=1 Tax=Acinetobacter colistiniresistens TaxID=280145 RepID=S3TPN5_9GAMM|nr:tetraacyldisaccharide 4'-kinase [Acinetobacter colistiniresistens]EPG37655.1 tetraacyldisaccharide 4'-kinase [Acinetobacter colistiniresistens]TVT85462.1 tetraacyldisaccharide 4'-kinase [Acinetobacter colistiniresistens]
MSMAQRIQDAWNEQASWLVLLRPLSWLYRLGFCANQALYQHGIKPVYQAPVPVMVIGNITVGGSGKTPLLIQLVKYLQQHNLKVGVISRGYGGTGPFPLLVTQGSEPEAAGDEPCLIVQSTHVPMAVGPNRQAAIELLLENEKLDLIISDDGLQHWALARQIEWIVLDQNRGLGNEKLLPEGYLREPKSRLKKSTVIAHTKTAQAQRNMHLAVGEPYLLNPDVETKWFDASQYFNAVVGIGFPQRFYQTLNTLNVQQYQAHEFPDHHDYEIGDLTFDNHDAIITTEKDAVKFKALLKQNPEFNIPVWVVPVEADLSSDCYDLLKLQLQQVGIQFS